MTFLCNSWLQQKKALVKSKLFAYKAQTLQFAILLIELQLGMQYIAFLLQSQWSIFGIQDRRNGFGEEATKDVWSWISPGIREDEE